MREVHPAGIEPVMAVALRHGIPPFRMGACAGAFFASTDGLQPSSTTPLSSPARRHADRCLTLLSGSDTGSIRECLLTIQSQTGLNQRRQLSPPASNSGKEAPCRLLCWFRFKFEDIVVNGLKRIAIDHLTSIVIGVAVMATGYTTVPEEVAETADELEEGMATGWAHGHFPFVEKFPAICGIVDERSMWMA